MVSNDPVVGFPTLLLLFLERGEGGAAQFPEPSFLISLYFYICLDFHRQQTNKQTNKTELHTNHKVCVGRNHPAPLCLCDICFVIIYYLLLSHLFLAICVHFDLI